MQHPFENYVHVPGMIGIRTNIPGFRWGFGACSVPAPEDAFDACRVKVHLEARRDRAVFADTDLASYTGIFRDFRAKPQEKTILFDKKIGPVRLRFSLSVQGDFVKVIVGRSYLRLIRLKLMYIHPIAYVLFDVVSLLLLQQNLTTLYGSAVRLRDGRAAFCAAAPNTGKSLTVLQLQQKHGARIITEDMAVTDGVRIWGAPYTGLYRNYHDENLKAAGPNPESDAFAPDIAAVFLLQKGSPDCEMQSGDILHQLLLINRYSLGYYYSPCVRVLDFYNSDLNVSAAQEAEERILGRLIGDAQTLIVQRQNALDFAQAIRDAMSGGEG